MRALVLAFCCALVCPGCKDDPPPQNPSEQSVGKAKVKMPVPRKSRTAPAQPAAQPGLPPGMAAPPGTAPATPPASAPVGPESPALKEGKALVAQTAKAMGAFAEALKASGGGQAEVEALKQKFEAENQALSQKGQELAQKLTDVERQALQAHAKQQLGPVMQQLYGVMVQKGLVKPPTPQPPAPSPAP